MNRFILSLRTMAWPVLALACALATAPVTADSGARPGAVQTGIDVLVAEEFARLQGSKVGLITNQTGIDRSGVSTIQRLHEAPGLQLVALFSPEHGLAGKLDIPFIGDTEHEGTGLEVHSLYGETRQPTSGMLQGIDTLVFDIQDIGTRYYTYISTLGLAMQSAAREKIRFVVLDRPNPINGVNVAGPVIDPDRTSFTAFHALPVRHGMTVGELALMFREELGLDLDLDLEVVAVQGWDRAWHFDRTGLRWVNPSPNMRSLTQALLYPGIGLLETTNLSVGRGTDTPFEHFGAPWLDGDAFARRLNALELPGAAFVSVRFTPDASKFAGEACSGVNVVVTDRVAFDPVRTGLEIAVALRREYPEAWEVEPYDRLLAHAATLSGLREGLDAAALQAGYQADLERFRQRRARFLLYP